MKKDLRNFLNGMAFGITETVPGVSGGTIAIILGFYDELITGVNHFSEDIKKYLRFFFPILLGVAFGVISFSSIISYLLTNYSFPTMLFFIGLIVGIIPIIYKKVKEPGRELGLKEIMQIVIPMAALIIVTSLKSRTVTNPAEIINNITLPYMLFIFIAGIIAAAALVIPGVSGSFVLLMFGIYPLATYSVSNIRLLLFDMTNMQLLADICKVLAPLAIGVVIGGLSTARVIERLLENYYKTTYSIILGLLLASVYVLFNEPIVFQSGISTPIIITGVLTFLGGCMISFTLGRKRL